MSNELFDLHLPVFSSEPLPHRSLSTDEFGAFVTEDLDNCFDREAYLREKAQWVVNVKFVFDENRTRHRHSHTCY